MCEDEIYQNGNVNYQSWIRGVPVKKWAACIDTVCMWNVGVQRVDIHSDHNRFRGDKMLDVIKFSNKVISVSYQTMYIMQKRLENGINISINMFCKCSFRRCYWSVWGLMFRLLALSINCVVLIKLPSVMYLLVLADVRWLSLCSFGKALNVPGVAFTRNSCELCNLLLDDMWPMMILASSLCVSTISDVVPRYVLLSAKIRLQLCI